MNKGASTGDRPIRSEPIVVEMALMRIAPRLPRLSITTFAIALPSKPPTGKTEVTAENVASDIGMQAGSL